MPSLYFDVKVGQRVGTLAYLDAVMKLCDPEEAVWAKLSCDDGYRGFYKVRAESEVTKGDLPGHEFHGNQYTTEGSGAHRLESQGGHDKWRVNHGGKQYEVIFDVHTGHPRITGSRTSVIPSTVSSAHPQHRTHSVMVDPSEALGKKILSLVQAKKFDPDQLRDEYGRWTTGGAGTGSPAARQGMVPDYSNPKTLASMRRTAQAAASDVHAIATSIDKLVTDDMKEVVGENMRLAGLSNRIKTEESLARKIFDESVDDQIDVREKAATIKDALRYTAVSSDKDYTSNVVRGVSALKAKGYTLMEVHSRWGEGTDYQGINSFFKTPGGQVFELQFHTARSFYVKSKLTRDDYNIWRSKASTRKQRNAAYKRMVETQKTVHAPPGVGTLSFAVSP